VRSGNPPSLALDEIAMLTVWYSSKMKLEFCYRDHYITLLSSPVENGWIAKCQVEQRIGDQDLVHTLSDNVNTIYSTLEDANRCAKKLAKAWVDEKIRTHLNDTSGTVSNP
jgi:hypothetical protein